MNELDIFHKKFHNLFLFWKRYLFFNYSFKVKDFYNQNGKKFDQMPDLSGTECVDKFLAEKIISIIR